jgi:23S rRNA (uridine2552-2'-O)-methyltransferase
VKKAAEEKRGSRAHFKLAQLDARFGLARKDAVVVELGAAPGGWTRYLAPRVARVVAIDLLDMPAIATNVTVARLDIHSHDFDDALRILLGKHKADLVLSDMAPNISGVKVADQAASMALVDLATLTAQRFLNPGGALVVKMFQGEGVDEWIRVRRDEYQRVVLAKPEASRAESREVYGVALRWRGADAAPSAVGGA